MCTDDFSSFDWPFVSENSFRKKIHDCLLQTLSQTNDYPDVPALLGQMHHIQNRP